MRLLWRRRSVQFEAKESSQPIWRPKKEIFARPFVFRHRAWPCFSSDGIPAAKFEHAGNAGASFPMPTPGPWFQNSDRRQSRCAQRRSGPITAQPCGSPQPGRCRRQSIPRCRARSCCRRGFFSDRPRTGHCTNGCHWKPPEAGPLPANMSLPAQLSAARCQRWQSRKGEEVRWLKATAS